MQIIDDPKIFRPLIEKAIEKYGFAPEHNLDWFLTYANKKQKPLIAKWPDESVIMAYAEPDIWWYTFSEPLAPLELRGEKVVELAEYALRQSGIKQLITEAREDTLEQIVRHIPTELKIVNDTEESYTLIWPVMNMQTFDPQLSGGHFKYLRNAKNKFYREHDVQIKDAKTVSKKDLYELLDGWVAWVASREGKWLLKDQYYNLIDADFCACKTARVMMVDGTLVGLNAGWEIPHSKNFYAGIGIHDYSVNDLGIMLYLEDLIWIKNAGYPYVDMGGSADGTLDFKKQFLPESYYNTYVFSIMRK